VHREPETFKGKVWGVSSYACSSDGESLFTAEVSRAIRIWDTATLQQRFVIPHTNSVDSMALSKDENLLLSGDRDGNVRLFRRATEGEVQRSGR
jgi:WD40 repeat protein